jgi:hypothetical protein
LVHPVDVSSIKTIREAPVQMRIPGRVMDPFTTGISLSLVLSGNSRFYTMLRESPDAVSKRVPRIELHGSPRGVFRENVIRFCRWGVAGCSALGAGPERLERSRRGIIGEFAVSPSIRVRESLGILLHQFNCV